jgi:hypothetical protein
MDLPINGRCRTNIDDYDCSKVKEFACVPSKGDRVAVTLKGEARTLVVVAVTHDVDKVGHPFIIVELHHSYSPSVRINEPV